MEQNQAQTADENSVLSVKPLRRLVPVFQSSPNSSSCPAPQGGSPFVYALPSGPFPPGIAAFYPFFGSQEVEQYYSTPVSNAVPINSYRTPQSANGDAGSSARNNKGSGQNQFADEDGNKGHCGMYATDGEDTSGMGKQKLRSRRRVGDADSNDIDTDLNVNSIIEFNLAAIDNAHQADGNRDSVCLVRIIYDLLRRRITQIDESKSGNQGAARRSDLRAGSILFSKGIRTNTKKRFGAVPGIEVGDIFFFRIEMCVVGLHAPSMAGIDYIGVRSSQEEEPLAVSIVSSGGYEDNNDDGDVLIYSGQGGNLYNRNRRVMDQKLERGNLALEKSLHRGNEVRVIRGVKESAYSSGKVYVYDGLYRIQQSWMDKGKMGYNMFKYKLIRIPGQPQAFNLWQSIQLWKDGLSQRPGTILRDLTSGAEIVPVSLVNDIDNEKGPAYFTYIPSLNYSKGVKLTEPSLSCACTGVCLPSNGSCSCIQKNEGYLPCNASGILVSRKSMVYECGLSCHCSPNCRNRATQSGLKLRLEVFRTKNKGWGLRSWDPIRAGTYICEYAGEVVDVVDNKDCYIFDATRTYPPLECLPNKFNEDPMIPFPLFISAKDSGNVARFMNHSCSPNVLWQPVLRGNKNKCDLHVAFHAVKHVPPMTELTYDYGNVQSDMAGKLKKKCLCGSIKCRGHFY